MRRLQACLGVSRKQLGADRFGDVVKTGSSSALACVTLWNVVRVMAPRVRAKGPNTKVRLSPCLCMQQAESGTVTLQNATGAMPQCPHELTWRESCSGAWCVHKPQLCSRCKMQESCSALLGTGVLE